MMVACVKLMLGKLVLFLRTVLERRSHQTALERCSHQIAPGRLPGSWMESACVAKVGSLTQEDLWTHVDLTCYSSFASF